MSASSSCAYVSTQQCSGYEFSTTITSCHITRLMLTACNLAACMSLFSKNIRYSLNIIWCWSEDSPISCTCMQSFTVNKYRMLRLITFLVVLASQVVLSSDAPFMPQFSGPHSHGLCHLTRGQNTDVLYFCEILRKHTYTNRQEYAALGHVIFF